MREKRKRSPFTIIFIVFSLIMFFGLISTIISQDEFGGVSFQGKVGVIKIEGIIFDSEEYLRQLDEFAKNKSIKAIVLRINSPGGAVAPSQEIYREILRVRKKKKVVASMGTVAASGGYYIACAADEIYANPGTITGSIGVIMEVKNIQGLMSKIGVSAESIKSGALKDVGNPMREITDSERDYLQAVIMDIYEQFVEDVSKGRQLDKAKVYPIADGRILTGRKALEEKLIDKIGTIRDAIIRAGVLGGIDGEPSVVYAKKRLNFFGMVIEDAQSKIKNLFAEKGLSISYLMQLPSN